LSDPNNMMEPLESSIVRATGVVLPANIGPAQPMGCVAGMANSCQFAPGASNCDFTGDGQIDFNHPLENVCANACQKTVGCSEWNGWTRFGQIAVDFMAGQPAGINRLVFSPKQALPDFDPTAPPVAATTAPITVTGTLKQVGPTWIIEPRCTQDIALDNMPGDVRATCVFPRAVDENGP
jgi:hypothetical protein